MNQKKKRLWHFTFVLFLLCYSNIIMAQDTLYKKDGSKVAVKVLIVGEYDIVYLPYDRLTSLYQYRILRNALLYIRYENKWVDSFSNEPISNIQTTKIDVLKKDFGRNRFSFYLSDPIASMLSFQYERLYKKGYFGIAIPISTSMTALGLTSNYDQYKPSTLDYYNKLKTFSTGLQINYYPFGQGTFTYWIGGFSEYGIYRRINFYTILLQNGIIYHPHKHIHTSFSFSYGGIQSRNNGSTTLNSSTFRTSLLIGYTF